MTNAVTNGVSKIIYASLKDASDRLLVLPSPANSTWNQGIAEQIVNQTNDYGDLYVADAVATGRDPAFTLNYQSLTKELLALKTGFQLETQADTGIFVKSFQVKKSTYDVVAAGQDGFGMVADTASASVLRKGISVPLERQSFATFAPATASSFAQGANAAFKFSDDIVAAKEWVTVMGTYPVTDADVLSETLFDTFTMSLVGILHDKTVFNIVFDPVGLKRQENNEIGFGAQEQNLVFRITDPSCVPKVKFLNRTRAC